MTFCFLRSTAVASVSKLEVSFLLSPLHREIKLSGTLCVGSKHHQFPLAVEGEKVRLIYKSCQIQLTPIESVIDIDTITSPDTRAFW